MTLNQLIYFCTMAEMEHYGRAARRLYISQPSLSKAMAGLEQELDVILFHRQGRNVALTEAGKRYYEMIKPALKQIEAARHAMESFAERRRPPVIGSVSPAVTAVLTPLMDAFLAAGHADPKPEIRVDTSEMLVEALRNGSCDFAFCTRVPEATDIHFHLMARLPFVVVMRDDDPLAALPALRLEHLSGRPMAFARAPAYNTAITRLLQHYNIMPVVHSTANDDAAMFGVVRSGTAIFITCDYPQLYSNGLAIRPLEQNYCRREIYLAYTEKSLAGPGGELARYAIEKWEDSQTD